MTPGSGENTDMGANDVNDTNGHRASAVRALLAAHLPDRRVSSVVLLGEGEDNTAYEIDGELVVRFGREPEPRLRASAVAREARLLSAVAALSPVPVPAPVFVDPGHGCLAYRRLPGRRLLDLPAAERAALAPDLAPALGAFLTALHGAPVAAMAELAPRDDHPPEAWLAEAREAHHQTAHLIPERHSAPVEAFLAAPPPPAGDDAAFAHNDLGAEHVLADPASRALTGVIDWTDAAITDPSRDFARLYRDLGPAALRGALRHYPSPRTADPGFHARIAFFARCTALEDLAYGMSHAPYLHQALTSLSWLFPPVAR